MMLSLFGTMLAFAVQQPATPSQPPLRVEPMPIEATPANEIFYEDAARGSTPQARLALGDFGRCAVENSRALAERTMVQDFRSPAYRRDMTQLVRNNGSCFRQNGRMSGGNLLFAGAIAEALLSDTAPLNARLARAAARPATRAFSPTDRVAICTVRSVPDQVASLIATGHGTPAELAAMEQLVPAIRLCSQGGARMQSNPAGLRAMLATAAYRSVASAGIARESASRN